MSTPLNNPALAADAPASAPSKCSALARLSKRQRELLEAIDAMPLYMGERPIPLYIENWTQAESWYSESKRRRWLKNLEKRGLIQIKDSCFLYLTGKGKAAINTQTKDWARTVLSKTP